MSYQTSFEKDDLKIGRAILVVIAIIMLAVAGSAILVCVEFSGDQTTLAALGVSAVIAEGVLATLFTRVNFRVALIRKQED